MNRYALLLLFLPVGSTSFIATQACGFACTNIACASDVRVKQSLQVTAPDLDGATARICAGEVCETATLQSYEGQLAGSTLHANARAVPNAAGGYDVELAWSDEGVREPAPVEYTYLLTASNGTILIEASGTPSDYVNDYPNGEACDADDFCRDGELSPSQVTTPIQNPGALDKDT